MPTSVRRTRVTRRVSVQIPFQILFVILLIVAALPGRPGAQGTDPARQWSGGTTLLAPLLDGTPPPGGPSPFANAVSTDGRFVVFKSAIATLVPNDTNGIDDIFVFDRLTKETTRVNVSSSGDQAGAASDYPAISADSRFVSFTSAAANLVSGDTNDHWDVFVHDRVAHTTALVSRSFSDSLVNADNTFSAVSTDGRFVAFMSAAYDMTLGLTRNGQLFMRDRDVDGNGVFDEPGNVQTSVISVSDDGTAGNLQCWPVFDMTPDGRFVAFASLASNLVPNDTNGMSDIFVRDLQTGHTSRVSVSTTGTQTPASTYSGEPSISADGRFVVFYSTADNLVPNDGNLAGDVFLHDSQTGVTEQVSLGTGVSQSDGDSFWPSVSDDGRYVAFQSNATNLGAPTMWDSVFVRDRQTATLRYVNRDASGVRLLFDAVQPAISGDGSTVIFATRDTENDIAGLYAAVDFVVTPASLSFDSNGTEQTVTVTTTAPTPWTVVAGDSWITPVDGAGRAGSGTLRVTAAQNTGTSARYGTLTVGTKTINVTQHPSFALKGLTPIGGSTNGGTTVTISGIGFEPGATVAFGGIPATSVTVVNSTTMTAVTPPRAPQGLVDVEVVNGTGQRRVWSNGFRYYDTTPPIIQPIVNGPVGNNGWFIGDVTIAWSVTDPESPVTYKTFGCYNTLFVRNDTRPTAPYTCEAESHGGRGWLTYVMRRDTTRPTLAITSPLPTIFPIGQSLTASYTCADTLGSGIDTCVGSVPDGTTLDTSTPGIHDITVTTTDKAGWSSARTITYGVATGVCRPMPSDIVGWWTGDNTLGDSVGPSTGALQGSIASGGMFEPGLIGSGAFRFTGTNAFKFGSDPALKMTNAFTVSAWIYATNASDLSRNGIIVRREGEYGLLLGNGNLRYTFGAYDYSLNHPIPQNAWTHVAMTYDAGALTVYANGRPIATAAVASTLVDAAPYNNDFMIGGIQGLTSSNAFNFSGGSIDDVQVYRRALTVGEVESMFLSGPSGTCLPPATALSVSPASATYGPNATATVTARLTTEGAGLAGRTLAFTLSGAPIGTVVTDGDGSASVTFSVANKNAGTYTNAIRVHHAGDTTYQASTTTATLKIDKAPTTIVWPAPAPIVYGTNLSSTYFNATVEGGLAGTFTYTPAITSTPPNAGPLTLTATFRPYDFFNYLESTASVVLQVQPATPTISVSAGTFTYDKQPHAAVASAKGVLNEALTYTVTYNGSPVVPVDAGTYTVVVSVDASQNYNAASVTALMPLIIRKAKPAVTVGGYTSSFYTYDRNTHPATASATGVGGEALTPVTITYNGATDAPVNAGEYAIVATYAETQNYEAATASTTLSIRKATPSLSASIGGSPAYTGQPQSTVTATATGVGGEELTPVIIKYNGGTDLPVNAGDYTVVVSYEASQNYEAATQNAGTFTIGKTAPTLTVAGGAFAYDGAPHPAAVTASGVLGEPLPAVTVTYNGASAAPVHGGTYQVIASLAESQNYSSTSRGATIVISPALLTVIVNHATKPFGAPLPVFTASFSGFVNGDTPLSLAGALAFSTTATSESPVGTYPVMPSGLASNDYAISFGPGVLSVQPASTATTVSASANPSGVNQPVTFTASVSVIAPGAGQPTGTLRFLDGSLVLGEVPLQNGAGSLTTILATGTHAISVLYLGDGSFAGSEGSLTQTVNSSTGSTTATVSSSLNPSKSGQSVTLTARVTSPAGTPTGTVEFLDSGVVIGTRTLSAGAATLATTALTVGSHPITVRYLGSGAFPPSLSSTLVQVVNTSSYKTKSTSMALAASPSTGSYGTQTTFTATVTASGLFPSTPTGQVLFAIDGVPATVAAVSGSGRNASATLSTSELARGKHLVTVTYLGDSTYAGSTATITYVVN